MRGIFITGTDTGVGKTMVGAAIAAAATKRGMRVGVSKPIETGARENKSGHLVGEDCARLAAAAGNRQLPEEVASYLLRAPAAPVVAAREEHAHVDTNRLAADVRHIAALNEFTIVEGAGGLMVPITDDYTYTELAIELGFPVLVVVGSRLGCVNHALLTLDALQRHGLRIAGWILKELAASDPNPVAARTNRELIASFTPAKYLGTMRWIGDGKHADFDTLAQHAEESLELRAFL
ncbi:MAG: dethiobiotin synthetase [Hyphomicrobiaceae bacterium]|jgi:dethiobiotin synthetase